MMNMIKLQCPGCGATLEVDDSRQYCFCSYCGTKIRVQNENEYIYRRIDEAEVAHAETDRMIRLRELEMEAREKKADNIKLIGLVASVAILLVIGMIGFAVDNAGMGYCTMFAMLVGAYGFIYYRDKREAYTAKSNIRSGKIKLTDGNSLKGKNVEYVRNMLMAAGFDNIQLVPMNDLTNSLFIKPGRVKTVIINGKEEFDSEEWFPKSAVVTIIYHSLGRR